MASTQEQFRFIQGEASPIPGLKLIKNFISEEEEKLLIQAIDAEPWNTELKRRVQHYGYRYDYKARAVKAGDYLGPLPRWTQKYAESLFKDGHFSKAPDQLIVNEYQLGQGIALHTDCVPCFGEAVASVSLGSACVMDFYKPEAQIKSSRLLEARSALVLSGEARAQWQHGIAARRTDYIEGLVLTRGRRLSLTFRTVNRA